MSFDTQAREIGTKIGHAIARDVIADDMPRQWTGLDAQDSDQLTLAGIEPDSAEWLLAAQAAKDAFEALLQSADQ